ncbi:GIY-YIG nuclease family protein [Pontibacter beigongshangensis]|uniref:excinuclease ABC subunit C n=1 Tax=Pontibacter beigongshangensis TaxID=2574733 RepID=UPI00164F64E3|nr:excinuclease ABC subunit C [Pontibacter beigongshangensis]
MTFQDTHFFVYIYGDQQRSQVQIGVAADLEQRDQLAAPGSTSSQFQGPDKALSLVYYEHYDLEAIALERERQLKENPQEITYSLINSMNPNWLDLSDTLN